MRFAGSQGVGPLAPSPRRMCCTVLYARPGQTWRAFAKSWRGGVVLENDVEGSVGGCCGVPLHLPPSGVPLHLRVCTPYACGRPSQTCARPESASMASSSPICAPCCAGRTPPARRTACLLAVCFPLFQKGVKRVAGTLCALPRNRSDAAEVIEGTYLVVALRTPAAPSLTSRPSRLLLFSRPACRLGRQTFVVVSSGLAMGTLSQSRGEMAPCSLRMRTRLQQAQAACCGALRVRVSTSCAGDRRRVGAP